MNLKAKIEANILIDKNGCWLWQKSKRGRGYGQICFDKKILYAHRVSYEVFVGPIPEGMELDHVCRVRHCVNPKHLEPVDHRENMRRSDAPMGVNSRKSHCKRGHELNNENVHEYKGQRRCKACWPLDSQKYRDKAKSDALLQRE